MLFEVRFAANGCTAPWRTPESVEWPLPTDQCTVAEAHVHMIISGRADFQRRRTCVDSFLNVLLARLCCVVLGSSVIFLSVFGVTVIDMMR